MVYGISDLFRQIFIFLQGVQDLEMLGAGLDFAHFGALRGV